MALGCEVDNVVYVMDFEDAVYTFFIADVPFDEEVVLSARNFFEILFVSCVGEFINVDDFDVVSIGFEEIVDEV